MSVALCLESGYIQNPAEASPGALARASARVAFSPWPAAGVRGALVEVQRGLCARPQVVRGASSSRSQVPRAPPSEGGHLSQPMCSDQCLLLLAAQTDWKQILKGCRPFAGRQEGTHLVPGHMGTSPSPLEAKTVFTHSGSLPHLVELPTRSLGSSRHRPLGTKPNKALVLLTVLHGFVRD